MTRDERTLRQTSIDSHRLQWSCDRSAAGADAPDPTTGMSSSLTGLMILFSDVGGMLVAAAGSVTRTCSDGNDDDEEDGGVG